MRIAREEIFGPVITATPFRTLDEVMGMSNTTHYGLAGGIWTRNLQKAHQAARALQSGVVWVYGCTATASSTRPCRPAATR